MTAEDHHGAPPLPPGRAVELPGRGRTFVRELAGPAGAPAVLLLHGWTATADLNWFPAYGALGRRYRVVALDHRGHGRGIRSRRRFRLADCADDAAALCDALGIDRVVAVGYSMGGPIASLLAYRHPELVSGLVLCATAARFAESPSERAAFVGLAGLSQAVRMTPKQVVARLGDRIMTGRVQDSPIAQWARSEVARGNPRMVLEAGASLGRFSSLAWIGGLEVPAAVVVSTQDRVVAPRRQLELAAALPGAVVHRVDMDHAGCVTAARRFVPALLRSVSDVVGASPPARRAVREPAPA
ncbi:MAG: alpha/beta fold hydrolase [Actinobacteria bacterium]|nr:alpha/beta fold hydrolase [Actinomycetota bacterium]